MQADDDDLEEYNGLRRSIYEHIDVDNQDIDENCDNGCDDGADKEDNDKDQ